MALDDIVPQLTRLQDTLEGLRRYLEETSQAGELKIRVDLQHLINQVEGQIRTAEREFTIAVVGEFKVGKSTLLNGLLGLTGEAALSAEDTPDTACSIMLRHRQPDLPEARLVFLDGSVVETTWAQAKRLTSQVYLDQHPAERGRAHQLREVEYFVASPLLAQAQLNDLPGVGSRYWDNHTELTHKIMKEADAILWVVADREPSQDARHALSILSQYARSVIPIINVIEDPKADPPLPRRPEREQELADILLREFRDFFSPEIEAPLLVSARVIEIERAKPRPFAEVLREAGLDDLLGTLERLFFEHREQQAQGRRSRLRGVALAVINEGQTGVEGGLEEIDRKVKALHEEVGGVEKRVRHIASVDVSLLSSIRILAEAQALEICDRIAHQAGLFIEDQMQITRFSNLGKSLTAKGRERLSGELRDKFLDQLHLRESPNWLDHMSTDFAEQARNLALAEWSALGWVENPGSPQARTVSLPFRDLQRLGEDMRDSIVSILARMLGVAGFTGLIALLPGAQALIALGFVGASSLAATSNPLAERRRRAAETIMSQIRSQRFAVAEGLRSAGQEGSRSMGDGVKQSLNASLDEKSRRHLKLVDLRGRIQAELDGLSLLRQGFDDYLYLGGRI